MKVGDLVKVVANDLRTSIGSIALVTKVKWYDDGYRYWAQMTDSGHSYWFRREWLEVISASR
jgi:hypothetical protein